MNPQAGQQIFVVAKNPEADSKLPYLLWLPVDEGLALKARDTWPRSARIYCHPFGDDWPKGAEVIEETPVASCRRRGPVIDLVLDRTRLARSQFVFTETRGRPAIFWQTQKAARASNPGARIPRARALPDGFTIAIDTRERYPYRFAGRGVNIERLALSAGDYAVALGGALAAAVERKTFEGRRYLPLRVDGLETTRRVGQEEAIRSRVLILTTFERDEYVFEALRAGASGFLLKNAPPEELVQAVRIVAAGDALLAPSITRRVIED